MPTLASAAHSEPYLQQPSIILLPPSGSARKSCSPTTLGAYESLPSGLLQQESTYMREQPNLAH
eukprot:1156365-Pelagomonas_calceolata.AAC.1